MSAPHTLFASCAPGLEPLLAEELRALGALAPEVVPGGVAFRGHRRAIYRANLESGLATRVLVQVGVVRARYWNELARALTQLEWERFLTVGAPRELSVKARRSRLHHTDGIAERAARAIAGRLGDTCADPAAKGQGVYLRVDRDMVTASVDTSGDPLHRRGYRTRTVAAPLREDLARALLVASGWDRESPLVDPFSGSGTIPIEAASMARGLPPGRGRGFAFERSPLLHAATWSEVRQAALGRAREQGPRIIAADHSAEAATTAAQNARAAGLDEAVERVAAPVSALDLSALAGGGALVTHPPFGRRSSPDRDLAPLYRAVGRRVAELPASVAVAAMVADRRLGMRIDRRLKTAFLADAGGTKVRALVRRADSS